MKRRLLKKKNTLNRFQYIADKIGTIKRSIWVEYFKKHPRDLPKVLKKIRLQGYKSVLKHDVRENYHDLSFNQKLCDWAIWQLENGYFGKYVKLDKAITEVLKGYQNDTTKENDDRAKDEPQNSEGNNNSVVLTVQGEQ